MSSSTTTASEEELEWVIECPFDPPHEHRFPLDWQFAGPDGNDFRADPRWRPSVYIFFSDRLTILHTTTVPRCDDEAIDMFSQVNGWFENAKPKWIRVRRPDWTSETLPVIYDADTDEVFET